jgi:putative peptidoglycan lipid II flippase
VNVLVNNNFASYLGDGAVSWLNVAFRFMQLPIGLFGVAVGTVTLPLISRHAARGETARMRRTVTDGLELALLFAMPAACGLVVLGGPIIALIYEHGRFTAADTQASAHALAGYAVGLAGYAGIKIVAPAFYALGDVRTPMRVSLISIGVNYLMNWMLVRRLGFGHVGLALSTATVATLNFLWLFMVLRRRLEGIEGHRLAGSVLRIAAAAGVMSACVYGLDGLLAARLPGEASAFLAYAIRVAAGLAAGGGVFAASCWVVGLRPAFLVSRRERQPGGAPPPPAE